MNEQKTVLISGASGLVGSALAASFRGDGYRVLSLSRSAAGKRDAIEWSPTEKQLDGSQLEGVDVVVHLAGENIAQRWSSRVKQQIRDSRVLGTRLLAETLVSLDQKPRVFCSASAIGFYGNRGDEICDESSEPGTGFLVDVCRDWEAACEPAWTAGIRVCQARIGLVLSPEGGVLGKVLTPFRLGAGGVLGNGKQYMSWITRNDLVAALRFMVDREDIHGAINCTAPEPVTNYEFTKTLGRVIGRPTLLPAPTFALKMAMGEMAEQVLLAGQRVIPTKLMEAGFEFEHQKFEPALRSML